jgi:hypothetical protein
LSAPRRRPDRTPARPDASKFREKRVQKLRGRPQNTSCGLQE